ncbi:MAG: tetratricopeptide repeat protein [Salibacteraceae bacterium]
MARKSKANFRKKAPKGTPKGKAAAPIKQANADVEKEASAMWSSSLPTLPLDFDRWKWLFLILGFALYANTIGFQYALDDKLYVTGNNWVKDGFDGIPDLVSHDLLIGFYCEYKNLLEGGRYRPLPLITHAIEWELFGESPQISHFLNALLYGLTGFLLFILLTRLLPPDPKTKIYASLPFLATLLWTVHPLHTEVTANIKSRDELMAVLFSLIALNLFFKYVHSKQIGHLLSAVGIFFLALMSRESVATWAAGIPLALYFFSHHYQPQKGAHHFVNNLRAFLTNRENLLMLASIAVTTLSYLLIRSTALPKSDGEVFPELMNQPFMLVQSEGERYATIFYTMWMYLKLLVVPHPLTHDYYPFAIEYTNWSNPLVIFSVLSYLSIATMAVLGLLKRTVVGFGAMFFLLNFLLVSNLFFDVGSFMNERWMYVPSIGACLIFAWLLQAALKSPNLRIAVVGGIALLFSVLTFNRNWAWENDETLAMTDVYTSTGSAKAHMAVGSAFVTMAENQADSLTKNTYADSAIVHLTRALEIYPNWYQPMDILGSAYFQKGNIATSVAYYKAVLQIKQGYNIAINNLTILGNRLIEANKFDQAIDAYEYLVQRGHVNADIYSGLGKAYGKSGKNFQKAIQFLNQALELQPNDATILENLGICYASLVQFAQGIQYFESALQANPQNRQLMQNMSIVYGQMGNIEKANELRARAAASGQ